MHKLGVIVPYRNRYKQLVAFKSALREYLESTSIDYELIVVEQDNAKSFNRGKLLNIGFQQAVQLGCDYVVFHDVDMHPLEVDYSYTYQPLHLATNIVREGKLEGLPFPQYFGGVTLFPVELFEQINGYSNNYWGWGFEDDDLFYRAVKERLPVDTLDIKIKSSANAAVKFNGVNSSVRILNSISYTRPFSIHISFDIEKLELDFQKSSDKCMIFNVPGYDFNLHYNSFNRYVLEVFDKRGKIYTITSEITSLYKTNFTITWNSRSKLLCLYQESNLIGSVTLKDRMMLYNRRKYITLGCRTVEADETEYDHMKGIIDVFAVWNKELTKKSIISLSKNSYFGLTHGFDHYHDSSNLLCYYDAKIARDYKLVDLAGNNLPAELINCEIVPYDYRTERTVKIPYRRKSSFKVVDFKIDNYVDGRWRDQLTRYNQLRFINEVSTGFTDIASDGLSNLEYKIHSAGKVENETHLVVGI